MFEYIKEEKEIVLSKYFLDGEHLKLKNFPKKQKQKFLCLLWIKDLFVFDKTYSEKEVNEILEKVYLDYVTLRRYMIDFSILKRTRDGKSYWLSD
jgi:hypothetical protein